jgi:O-antigen/teichoic acid export membrane protein
MATTSMARDTFALMANVAINGALGLAFWLAAARLYPSEVVGTASATISAMILSAGIGWFGWQFVLIRYLPVAGKAAGKLLIWCYLVAITVAVPAAVIVGLLGPEAVRTHAGPTILAVSGIVWVIFSLQDPALIGLGRAALVPVENAAFGIAKLVAIVVLASVQEPMAIVGAWVVSAAAIAAVVNVAVLRPHLAGRHLAGHLPSAGWLVRFGMAQHLAAVATALPDSLVPLIVIGMLGESANAHYYAAWTVAFSLRLMAVNLANVYTSRAADQMTRVRARSELRPLALALVSVLVLAGLVLAGPALSLFGTDYEVGVPVLRWMAIGLIPFAYVTIAVAHHRVEGRSTVALAAGVTATLVTLVLDVLLLPVAGIEATGIAWLTGWIAAAGVVGLDAWRRDPAVPSVTARGP